MNIRLGLFILPHFEQDTLMPLTLSFGTDRDLTCPELTCDLWAAPRAAHLPASVRWLTNSVSRRPTQNTRTCSRSAVICCMT